MYHSRRWQTSSLILLSKQHSSSAAAAQMMPKLNDITGERLDSMNECGISMQVLSVENTDVNLLNGSSAAGFASKYNDLLAEKMKDHPDRFTAFAHLPMTAPAAAADELERTVKTYGYRGAMIRGHTNGDFLDAPKFAPVLERAEKLGVPIYIHPGLPPKTVIDAYYSNVGQKTGVSEAIAHSETAIGRYPLQSLTQGHLSHHVIARYEAISLSKSSCKVYNYPKEIASYLAMTGCFVIKAWASPPVGKTASGESGQNDGGLERGKGHRKFCRSAGQE
jgi:hypothetical protein